jgi:type IV secretory pathway TrbF-like protein
MESTSNKRPHIEAWKQAEAPNAGRKNVYLESRREWNERYGEYIAREHAWKQGFFVMGLISIVCAGGMAYLSSQSRLVPYVVAVDKLGSAVGVQRADVAGKPDARVIRAQLARWIESGRSVYQDAGAERVNVEYAYAMLRRTDPAFIKLNDYLAHHDPFERAKSEGVDVQIGSVMPISDITWGVQWKEATHSSKGEFIGNTEYQANLTIAIDPPTREATLLRNPMGIYIKNYDWSERLIKEEKK